MMHFHVEGHFHQLPTSSDGYVLTNTEPFATGLNGNTYTKICINPVSKRDIYCLFSYDGAEYMIDVNLMLLHVDP